MSQRVVGSLRRTSTSSIVRRLIVWSAYPTRIRMNTCDDVRCLEIRKSSGITVGHLRCIRADRRRATCDGHDVSGQLPPGHLPRKQLQSQTSFSWLGLGFRVLGLLFRVTVWVIWVRVGVFEITVWSLKTEFVLRLRFMIRVIRTRWRSGCLDRSGLSRCPRRDADVRGGDVVTFRDDQRGTMNDDDNDVCRRIDQIRLYVDHATCRTRVSHRVPLAETIDVAAIYRHGDINYCYH